MNRAERFKQLTCTDHLQGQIRKNSIRATLVTSVAGGFDFILRLGSTAILARLLLPEHFGLVMMVTAVTAIADQLRELGLSSATVQQKDITHQQVSNLFWVNVFVGMAISVIVCALSPVIAAYYHDSRLTLLTCAVSINFAVGGFFVQHQALLTRQLKLGSTSMIRVLASLVSVLLTVILAWLGWGYWALVWGGVARSAFLTLGMWWALPWVPSLPSRETDIRQLLGFGANLSIANIFSSIATGADRLLLGKFGGPAPVGVYRQAYQLVAAPTDQLLSPLYQVAQPALSLLQSDHPRYRRFYLKMLTIVCMVTMPSSLLVAVYAKEVTALLLGPNWVACAPIIAILSLGTFIKQPIGSAAFILITRGQSRRYLFLTLLHNVIFILFMWIGVRWNMTGIAIAEVAVTYCLIAPRLYYCLQHSPVDVRAFMTTALRPGAASLVMALVLLVLHKEGPHAGSALSLALGCATGFVVFFAIWMVLPGGLNELRSLFTDLQSAFARKLTGTNAAPPVTAPV